MSEYAGIEQVDPGHAFFDCDGRPISMGAWMALSDVQDKKKVVELVTGPAGREYVVTTKYDGVDRCSATRHSGRGPPGPWIFVTYVNAERPGAEVARYRSWDDALAGREEVVRALAEGTDPRRPFYVRPDAPAEGCER